MKRLQGVKQEVGHEGARCQQILKLERGHVTVTLQCSLFESHGLTSHIQYWKGRNYMWDTEQVCDNEKA